MYMIDSNFLILNGRTNCELDFVLKFFEYLPFYKKLLKRYKNFYLIYLELKHLFKESITDFVI
jgi:hypothetical protein